MFEQLTGEILARAYPAGSAIPSERELSEVLGVNRHVVREAVKRLEQVGLLKGTQGGRTVVLDYRRTAGLDLLALVAERADPSETLLPLLAAAIEMRAGIGSDLARLCAERAGSEVREQLVELAGRLGETSSLDAEALLELDRSFWQTMLDGAGNLAYQLAFNSLIRAVHALRQLSVPWLEDELARSGHRMPIAQAIAAGDAETAAGAARDALTPAGPVTAIPGVLPR